MARERILKQRKRRKASKGSVIRVSDLVYKTLLSERSGGSWDSFFRRYLGLPDRQGKCRPLAEGVLETISGRLVLRVPGMTWEATEQAAFEQAFMEAARRRMKKVSKPLRMRELP